MRLGMTHVQVPSRRGPRRPVYSPIRGPERVDASPSPHGEIRDGTHGQSGQPGGVRRAEEVGESKRATCCRACSSFHLRRAWSASLRTAFSRSLETTGRVRLHSDSCGVVTADREVVITLKARD